MIDALTAAAHVLAGAWAMLAPEAAVAGSTCVIAQAPSLAQATLASGTRAELLPAGIRIGDRIWSRCNGLPGGHPLAMTRWGQVLAVAFRDVGVHVFDGEQFRPLPGPHLLSVRGMASTGGRLWIGTGADGLWTSDGQAAPVRHPHPVLGKKGITAVHVDDRGRVHVGVDPRGWWTISDDRVRRRQGARLVGCFASRGRGVRVIAPGACAPTVRSRPTVPVHITALAVWRGALYVGTLADGLYRYRDGAFASLGADARMVNALVPVGDELFIATAKGLYRLGQSGVPIRLALGLPSEHVNGLAAGQNATLWIATGQGLVGWSRTSGRLRVIGTGQGLPSRIVYSVAQTEDGAVWAGTAAGVLRISPGGTTLYSRATGALPHDWTTSLLADGTDVVAGTYDAGVARLSPGGRGQAVPAFERAWVNPHGVRRFGNIWFAATLGEGLRIVQNGRSVPAPPLPSLDVTAVTFYRGRFVVGTRAGLAWLVAAPAGAATDARALAAMAPSSAGHAQ